MTMKPTANYKAFDVVAVPFPFTDSSQTKRRPAVVLSSHFFNVRIGHSVMAMITSAKNSSWPLDVPIEDLTSAGIKAGSVIRMKLFTLDHRFILKKIGSLAEKDQNSLTHNLKKCIELL